MTTCDQLCVILDNLKPELQLRYNVSRIGIFGSYVRGEQTDTSDVDILVEFSKPIGWTFVDCRDYLEEKLGKSVDLVTRNALKKSLRNQILQEVVYV
jgi:predicted nucleotidyltransferase